MKLADKVCVVTGAASGIGAAAAEALAAEGASVVLVDQDDQAGSAASEAISATGGTCQFIRCDVSNESEIGGVIAETVRSFGGIDVLVNNAGINPMEGDVVGLSTELWHRVLAVNLDSVFYASKYAIPEMRRRGGGSIINTASPGSFKGWRGNAAYLASKGAVLSLTRAMALDHAVDNIRVNALVPGLIMTGIGRDFLSAQPDPDAVANGIPLGRVGVPGDVAPLVVFLASDESRFSTGSPFFVDGGELAG